MASDKLITCKRHIKPQQDFHVLIHLSVALRRLLFKLKKGNKFGSILKVEMYSTQLCTILVLLAACLVLIQGRRLVRRIYILIFLNKIYEYKLFVFSSKGQNYHDDGIPDEWKQHWEDQQLSQLSND